MPPKQAAWSLGADTLKEWVSVLFFYKKVQQSLQVKNIPFIHSRTSPGVIKVLSWHQRPVLCLYQSPKAHDKIVRPFHKSHVLRKFMNSIQSVENCLWGIVHLHFFLTRAVMYHIVVFCMQVLCNIIMNGWLLIACKPWLFTSLKGLGLYPTQCPKLLNALFVTAW